MARDERLRTLEGELARIGLPSEAAVPALRRLGVWPDRGSDDETWAVIEGLARTANPDRALDALVRLAERRPEAWGALVAGDGLVARAAVVAGASIALGELIGSNPGALTELVGDLEPLSVQAVKERCRHALAEHSQPAFALADVQRRGLLRIAARDLLAFADTPTASAELADLAAGVLDAALEHVVATLEPDATITVIGMGKLGGRELNYVSDVDVLFVHEGSWADATKVCERFLRLLGEVTPAGRAYQVDTNLRPEGNDGPLARSLEAYQNYYEHWAKTWEFQALLKARPVAGDVGLGKAFAELAAPFVWPDRLDSSAVEEIQTMKGVVESSKDVRRAGARQVKLGPGGLRDIEFAVQLLQLVHGRHDPALRSPNTLEALQALATGGYVDEGDANLFSDAYQFLRTVEHRLQLERLRRTHTIPKGEAERRRLARTMGFRDIQAATALEQFDREFTRVQGAVRRLHEKLFYRPLLARFAEVGADEQVVTPSGGLDEAAARERLVALGFHDPDKALAHLDALASGVSRRARLLATLLPALLPTLAAAPDPDAGLGAFRSLAERLGQAPAFLHTLRDNPPVGELLAQVLGRSRVVGEWLERQPEVFNLLADLPQLEQGMGPDDYRRLADGLLRRGAEPTAAADPLRRLKRREVTRIAVRDLTGRADVGHVGAELTALAEACLEAAVGVCAGDSVRLAVIGMGKLGAGELSYASDLDVLFVFEPAETRAEALRACEEMLAMLSDITPEGQAFRVDPNLRPEGKDGPLGRTLDSYVAYYERWGATWELQALTQARPVAGDADLGAALIEGVTDLVYPVDVPPGRLQEIRQMKARVERERAGGSPRTGARRPRAARPVRRVGATSQARGGGVRSGDRLDLKLGPGGLSDVEWTVQLLQVRDGGRLPALRMPGTLTALAVCEREGILSASDAQWLRDGWRLLTRIRNALYLAGFRDTQVLPPGQDDQERLARQLGYGRPGAQALLEDLSQKTRRVRKVHERAFYDA